VQSLSLGQNNALGSPMSCSPSGKHRRRSAFHIHCL